MLLIAIGIVILLGYKMWMNGFDSTFDPEAQPSNSVLVLTAKEAEILAIEAVEGGELLGWDKVTEDGKDKYIVRIQADDRIYVLEVDGVSRSVIRLRVEK